MNARDHRDIVHLVRLEPTNEYWGFAECGKMFTWSLMLYTNMSAIATDGQVTCMFCVADILWQ